MITNKCPTCGSGKVDSCQDTVHIQIKCHSCYQTWFGPIAEASPKSRFQVGDTVICIDAIYRDGSKSILEAGNEYKIVKVGARPDATDRMIKVEGCSRWFKSSRFKLPMTIAEAEEIKSRFFKEHPNLKQYMDCAAGLGKTLSQIQSDGRSGRFRSPALAAPYSVKGHIYEGLAHKLEPGEKVVIPKDFHVGVDYAKTEEKIMVKNHLEYARRVLGRFPATDLNGKTIAMDTETQDIQPCQGIHEEDVAFYLRLEIAFKAAYTYLGQSDPGAIKRLHRDFPDVIKEIEE